MIVEVEVDRPNELAKGARWVSLSSRWGKQYSAELGWFWRTLGEFPRHDDDWRNSRQQGGIADPTDSVGRGSSTEGRLRWWWEDERKEVPWEVVVWWFGVKLVLLR